MFMAQETSLEYSTYRIHLKGSRRSRCFISHRLRSDKFGASLVLPGIDRGHLHTNGQRRKQLSIPARPHYRPSPFLAQPTDVVHVNRGLVIKYDNSRTPDSRVASHLLRVCTSLMSGCRAVLRSSSSSCLLFIQSHLFCHHTNTFK